jgi:hypothetical protein
VAAGASLFDPDAGGAELLPGDGASARHAAVPGQAADGARQRQPFPGVLPQGPRAAVRPLAAAQLHRSAGPEPSLTMTYVRVPVRGSGRPPAVDRRRTKCLKRERLVEKKIL